MASRFGKARVRVEARRARRKASKSSSRYPFLDLDFVDDEPLDFRTRLIYGLLTLACVIGALIGAVLPVIPAIPLWVMAAICLSHAFPAFGRWLRETRLYRWLIAKLNEPQAQSKRPTMARPRKDRLMLLVTLVMVVLLVVARFLLPGLGLPLPDGYLWYVSLALSVVWVALWAYLYLYVREPEATIRMGRRGRQRTSNPHSA